MELKRYPQKQTFQLAKLVSKIITIDKTGEIMVLLTSDTGSKLNEMTAKMEYTVTH